MKELIQYTSEFEYYDPKKPFVELEYQILISHDNSKEQINHKFDVGFLNLDNEKITEIDVNTWRVINIEIFDYYGRAKVRVELQDPKGTNLPAFDSGGFSLGTDEEENIVAIKETLSEILKEVRLFSLFLDYRSRLDYTNFMKKEHPDLGRNF